MEIEISHMNGDCQLMYKLCNDLKKKQPPEAYLLYLQPCSETYGGAAPFTEREASIVKNVFDQYENQIKLYVAIHSYGQYFLYPWGYDLYMPLKQSVITIQISFDFF